MAGRRPDPPGPAGRPGGLRRAPRRDRPGPARAYGEPTNLAFLRLAPTLATSRAPFTLATHDGVLREAVIAAHGPVPVEHLLGVRPDVVDDLVTRDIPVRAYVPYGSDWFRFWMRRVAESRGA